MSDFLEQILNGDDDDSLAARTALGTLLAQAVKVGVESADRRRNHTTLPAVIDLAGYATIAQLQERIVMPDDWIPGSAIVENLGNGPIYVFRDDMMIGARLSTIGPGICKTFPIGGVSKFVTLVWDATTNGPNVAGQPGTVTATLVEPVLPYSAYAVTQ